MVERLLFVLPLGLGLPLQIIHAQAMHHQQHPALTRKFRGHGVPVQGRPLIAQCHGGGEGIVAGDQLVSHHAVEGGEQGGAFGGFGDGFLSERHRHAGEYGIDATAELVGRPVDPPVDKTCNAPGFPLTLALYAHATQYRLVDSLRDLYGGGQGLCEQSGQLADVRHMPG